MSISVVKYLAIISRAHFSVHTLNLPLYSLPAPSSSKVDEVVELLEELEVSTVLTHVQ